MQRQPTAAEWAVIGDMFDTLVELPPDRREQRLTGADLPEFVQAQLRSLLAAEAGGGMLDRPLAADTFAEAEPSLAAGDRIGGFVIDGPIGRGGMGEVFAAHRATADFEQKVALKLLAPGPTARLDLFEHERRLLARLEHPGIARLIDGGITETARPWMAMEFVDGEAIDRWCARHSADLATRLRLFAEICEAVGAAHGAAIVHGDLKPANILVDRSGRLRLLDFGVARLVGAESERPQPVTARYAAPEQLDGRAPATVAADVHALGVVLYELLAGRSPWRGSGPVLPTVAARAIEGAFGAAPDLPSRVAAGPVPARAIAGDLDAIVMKAMQPDPALRYRTVAALGDDVVRHCQHRPVAARGQAGSYVFGRFVRRNRIAVAAAAAAVLALIGGSAGIAWQAHLTTIERNNAVAEAQRSEAVNQALTLMFRNAQDFGAGEKATVKDMLGDSAARLVASSDRSPRSALLITTIADLYVHIEDAVAAETLLEKALAAGVGGDDPAAVAQVRLRLGTVKGSINKPDEARPLLAAADAVFDADPERFRSERVDAVAAHAQVARSGGDRDRAIALLQGVLPAAERAYADKPRDLLTVYNNLLVNLAEAGRIDAMAPVFARADAVLKRARQERSVQALAFMQLRGVSAFKAGRMAEAEAGFARVVALRRALFAPSAGLAVDLAQLARVRLALGRPGAALPLLAEAQPLALTHLGAGALSTVVIGIGLAEARADTGDPAGAAQLLTDLRPRVEGLPPLAEGMWLRARAIQLLRQGDARAAAAALTGAEAVFRAAGPAGASYMRSVPGLRARIVAG